MGSFIIPKVICIIYGDFMYFLKLDTLTLYELSMSRKELCEHFFKHSLFSIEKIAYTLGTK